MMNTETKEFNLSEWMLTKTAEIMVQISTYQSIGFDKAKAIDYMKTHNAERFRQIVADVRREQEESKESFLFSSPGWQKKIFDTNLTHGILMYAKDILEHSKTDPSATIK